MTTRIHTKLPKSDDDGRRSPAPLIELNGYTIHPVIFNAMLADPTRGRAVLASLAQSGAEGIGCDLPLDTNVGRGVQRLFRAAEKLLDTMTEPDELADVASACIREACVYIYG